MNKGVRARRDQCLMPSLPVKPWLPFHMNGLAAYKSQINCLQGLTKGCFKQGASSDCDLVCVDAGNQTHHGISWSSLKCDGLTSLFHFSFMGFT